MFPDDFRGGYKLLNAFIFALYYTRNLATITYSHQKNWLTIFVYPLLYVNKKATNDLSSIIHSTKLRIKKSILKHVHICHILINLLIQ